MRTRTRMAVAVATATAACLLGTPAVADTAVTDLTVTLPVTGVADIVASPGQVFISGGPGSTGVAVVHTDGKRAGTVTNINLRDASDMQLSADGRRLYVALPTTHAIAVVSLPKLRVTTTYTTGTACPRTLALSGSWLYFGYSCGAGDGNIGALGLAGQPARYGLARNTSYGAPLLATPANGPILLTGDPDLSPTTVSVYTVEPDATLTWVSDNRDPAALGSNLGDLALTADGGTVFTAAGAPYQVQEFATSDLSQVRQAYQTGPYPNAVELTTDETRVAAGISSGFYWPDLYVFGRDGTAQHVIELGAELFSHALAWSPDGTRLYAVTGSLFVDPPEPATLHMLTFPAS